MEVCGTHTMSIARNGLRALLPPSIRLVSGPGCPVCVTPSGYIDTLITLAKRPGHHVLSFGDLLKVPGNYGSLSAARREGGRVSFLYSPFQALAIAIDHPHTQYIFAAVGFETTTAVYAALIREILERGIRNLKLLTALKTMIPALRFICEKESIDGFLCPGHVSAVIGSQIYEPLTREFQKPMVISGFEGGQILDAVDEILRQIEKNAPRVCNLYPEIVSERGNETAQALIKKYFTPTDAVWRGIGQIPVSGLKLRGAFEALDAGASESEPDGYGERCSCGAVMLGRCQPEECALFANACTPDHPVGACMVSAEGACGIHFQITGGTL
jgi:hydrogenase expression/formation protein HypD